MGLFGPFRYRTNGEGIEVQMHDGAHADAEGTGRGRGGFCSWAVSGSSRYYSQRAEWSQAGFGDWVVRRFGDWRVLAGPRGGAKQRQGRTNGSGFEAAYGSSLNVPGPFSGPFPVASR